MLLELLINAHKYAYAGLPGSIAIRLELHRDSFRLTVSNKGPGMDGTRAGFDTTMMNAMVKTLDGSLEESNNHSGLRVTVTAPLQHRHGHDGNTDLSD